MILLWSSSSFSCPFSLLPPTTKKSEWDTSSEVKYYFFSLIFFLGVGFVLDIHLGFRFSFLI
jgi:hypothetical protein